MAIFDWIKRRRSGQADTAAGTVGETTGRRTVSEPQDVEAAYRLHVANELDAAEKIYLSLLRTHPEDARVLHLLGTLHGQKGELAEAAKHLERAASLSPSEADILADLARVRIMAGNPGAAEPLLRKVVSLAPREARHRFALGQFLIQRGARSEAIEVLEQTTRLDPGFVDAFCDLGAACLEAGELDAAKCALESAIRLDESLVAPRLNLAHLHALVEEFELAELQYAAVIERDPAHRQAKERLGKLYRLAGEDRKALDCYRDLANRYPGEPGIWKVRGEIEEKIGLAAEAARSYEESLRLDARQPDTLVNLGALYGRAGKLEQAATRLESALDQQPDLEAAYHNLGATYYLQGRQDEALEAYGKALELAPDSHETLSNLIGINHYRSRKDPGYATNLFRRYLESLAPERVKAIIPAEFDRSPDRRLKIGYVSPDFRQHSVCYFIEPAIAGHDRRAFEVYCYSDVERPDHKTDFLRSAADHWQDIRGLNDDSVSALIRQDKVDVLVDLVGHFANNRLRVFAQKPAPVQIAYLGYPATTGLPEIDYRLTDAVTDPPGDTEQDYTEKLVRFPEVFLCYEPPDAAPPVSTGSPGDAPICFGSFNELPKLSPELVRAWAAILARVPDSTLLLKARAFSDEGTASRITRRFRDAGVAENRIKLLGRTPDLGSHLALYAQVDVALDTFPYNGTTTTCEALYMGVPVVTLSGDAHVSRVGASLMKCLGLDNLIAETEEDYIDAAVSLAGDASERARLRGTLRDRMLRGSLTDKRAFVSDLESIYRSLWKTRCETAPDALVNADRDVESFDGIAGAVKIRTASSQTVWVPNDPSRLTTYVLFEQEDWFEDEIAFLRVFFKEGMRVVDVGANYGLYTLLAAGRVGRTGQVWSVEPASKTYRWLDANVRYNGCDNTRLLNSALSDYNGRLKLQVFPDPEYNRLAADEAQSGPGEMVDARRLDACAATEGMSRIDFVKLDAEGAEKQILDGGRGFFAAENPLLMFEIRSGAESDLSLVTRFRALGYSVFRLAPGPGALVPVDVTPDLDPFALNLFACKEAVVDALAKRGLLVAEMPEPADASCSTAASVWAYLAERAYSRDLIEAWRRGVTELPAVEGGHLMRVLGWYSASRETRVPAGQALACLRAAYGGCTPTGTKSVDVALLSVKARVAADLGLRGAAVAALEPLIDTDTLPGNWSPRLPFLPPSSRLESITPGERLPAWVEASVLDAYLCSSAFSSYFTGEEHLVLTERLHQTGFERPGMERRRLLLSARLGRRTREPSDAVRQTSEENLNPLFWRRFRAEMLERRDRG